MPPAAGRPQTPRDEMMPSEESEGEEEPPIPPVNEGVEPQPPDPGTGQRGAAPEQLPYHPDKPDYQGKDSQLRSAEEQKQAWRQAFGAASEFKEVNQAPSHEYGQGVRQPRPRPAGRDVYRPQPAPRKKGPKPDVKESQDVVAEPIPLGAGTAERDPYDHRNWEVIPRPGVTYEEEMAAQRNPRKRTRSPTYIAPRSSGYHEPKGPRVAEEVRKIEARGGPPPPPPLPPEPPTSEVSGGQGPKPPPEPGEPVVHPVVPATKEVVRHQATYSIRKRRKRKKRVPPRWDRRVVKATKEVIQRRPITSSEGLSDSDFPMAGEPARGRGEPAPAKPAIPPPVPDQQPVVAPPVAGIVLSPEVKAAIAKAKQPIEEIVRVEPPPAAPIVINIPIPDVKKEAVASSSRAQPPSARSAIETRRAFSRGRHEPRARTLRQSIKYRPGFGHAEELRDRGSIALPTRRVQEERDRRNTKKKDKKEAERAVRRGLHQGAEATNEERMDEN